MIGGAKKETLKLNMVSMNEDGDFSETIETLVFHKMEQDPFNHALTILNKIEVFYKRIGIDPTLMTYLSMIILNAKKELDIFYECSKNQDLEELYERLDLIEEQNLDEDDEKISKEEKLEEKEFKILSFIKFKKELTNPKFQKYLYQIFEDDCKNE